VKITRTLCFSATSLRRGIRSCSTVLPSGILQTATVASQWNQKTCPSLLIYATYFAYYTSHRVAIALLRYGPYIPTAWVDASRGKKCVRQPLRPFCRLMCARKNKKKSSRLERTQQIRRHIRTQTQYNNERSTATCRQFFSRSNESTGSFIYDSILAM